MLERYLGASEFNDYFTPEVLPYPNIISSLLEPLDHISIQDSVNTAEASEKLPSTDDEANSGGSESADALPGDFQDAPCAPGEAQPGDSTPISVYAVGNKLEESMPTPKGRIACSRNPPIAQLRQFPLHNSNERGEGKFQCTFCTKLITNKYNWVEHEEAHLGLSTWACAPEGFTDPDGLCVYCKNADCREECHKKCECNRKGGAFIRKKYFQSHLRDVHKIAMRKAFGSWKRSAAPPQESRCGFCRKTFTNWRERMEHIGYEFKEGKNMEQWNGDWGLAEEWMAKLRNDTTTVFPSSFGAEVARPPVGAHAAQPSGSSFSVWIISTSVNY
jgi:hypothetical protein